ncbi:MAG: hypothetical protein OEY41_13450 [Acidimicrobiia bacterium]|nr:hypothetical protein [Acidimicrobiia bacterium]MDH4366476.1 hypothetical protein [Acidimicrobiia bacterium]MDH5290995.1 hypothetical protein [Acidimicrobiia bacterium]
MGDHGAGSQSYHVNFGDPASGVGAVTRAATRRWSWCGWGIAEHWYAVPR